MGSTSKRRFVLAGLLAGCAAAPTSFYLAQERPLAEFVGQHPWALLGVIPLMILPAVLYEAVVTMPDE